MEQRRGGEGREPEQRRKHCARGQKIKAPTERTSQARSLPTWRQTSQVTNEMTPLSASLTPALIAAHLNAEVILVVTV